MQISHKMTVPDKLWEIIRVKKWKQKELAGKLNVSEKTMSFWINGKKRPSESKEREISLLYNDIFSQENQVSRVDLTIQDYQSREGLDETEKTFTIKEKDYYAAKCYVLSLEKDNRRYIFLYPSMGKETDGWYKVGGKSLIFYKNLLAPRLGREAKIRDDTDRAHRFKNGIASIRWGNKLMEEAESLGYSATRTKFGVIEIDLLKDFADSEIKGMLGVVLDERNRVKKLVKPKENYPDLMMAMNKLTQVLPSKIKKLDATYREIWGEELLLPMVELNKIYFRFANGRMEKRDAKAEMLERTDDISAMIYMMDECGMLNITARTRLGENVVDIRRRIEEIV